MWDRNLFGWLNFDKFDQNYNVKSVIEKIFILNSTS